MTETEKKSSWGLLLKKAGGLYETSKIVAKNVKTAAQEWKEAKTEVMPQHFQSLHRGDANEFRKVSEFQEHSIAEVYVPCSISSNAHEHEIRAILWIMKRLRRTMEHGDFLSPTLYVPKQVWHQDIIKISSFVLKLSSCQELLKKLRDFHAATALLASNDRTQLREGLESLVGSIEVIQSGMIFQISGVEEEQETSGKEGLDKWKTLSYSFAKTASRIAHSTVDVTKLTPEQNKSYLGVLEALFTESQFIETLLTQISPSVPTAQNGYIAQHHPASMISSFAEETQTSDTVHPASLRTAEHDSLTSQEEQEVDISTTVAIQQRSDAIETVEILRLLVIVAKLLSRTVLRFVMDDLNSRLKSYHATQLHLCVDAFE